ncbi:MAG: helix-turn-helix domain-containing protein [Lachnospiraceae bacterium]|nr:helix-turn-helix domain-containing protein [Lachnospiraceae bacterium]
MDNKADFRKDTVPDVLSALFRTKKITKASLAKRANMSEVYLHQVFAGQRNPSRNRLLCMCLGMSATLDEPQALLKSCGTAQLYIRNRRDVIISFGLLQGLNVQEVNDYLFNEKEETLC